MERRNITDFTRLSDEECLSINGGSESIDYTVAEYLGIGLGYLAKKLWKGFQIYSANLYEMQKNTMVIYK